MALSAAGAVTAEAQAPVLSVSHAARALQPGEAVVLRVTSSAPLDVVRISAFGRTAGAIRLMSVGDAGEVWQAIVGIDVEVSPGAARVAVEATTTAGQVMAAGHALRIEPKTFRQRRLRVSPKFVSPPAAVRARIDREAARLSALYATVSNDLRVALPLTRPVPHTLNSPFGSQSIYNGQVRGRHLGVDFASPAGAVVGAPAPGRVVLADDLYYTGQTVVIDHGQGVHTIFAHLQRITVAPGALVATGAGVGEVGSTGRSSGPHLHWSLRVGGARVDPMSLVDPAVAR